MVELKNMDNQYISIVVAAGLAVWLGVLTFLYFSFYSKLRGIIKDTKGGKVIEVFEKVLESEKKSKKEIELLKRNIQEVTDDSVFHMQKLSIVRFNPFNETGGDHSFSMALLNGRDTGVVITGLHTRERTRLYVKPINRGKCEYELSLEEKKAIAKAQKN